MVHSASHCLAPICDANTRLLILGSLPGDKSLELGQYYGNPRNHFWPLVGEIIGANLPVMTYEAKLAELWVHRIGLWDVVASAERRGSLDQALRSIKDNDLAELVDRLPALCAIAFNGQTASRLGRKQFRDMEHVSGRVALIDLPSTSPANTMPYAEKAAQWTMLRAYVSSPEHRTSRIG